VTKRDNWHVEARDVRGPRIPARHLDALIEAIVDAYTESEQAVGFHATVEQHVELPFETVLLGVAVTVRKIDITRTDEIVAPCHRGRERQAVPILDLPLARSTAERLGMYRGVSAVVTRTRVAWIDERVSVLRVPRHRPGTQRSTDAGAAGDLDARGDIAHIVQQLLYVRRSEGQSERCPQQLRRFYSFCWPTSIETARNPRSGVDTSPTLSAKLPSFCFQQVRG
jgi:hypothetical protein